MQIVLTTAAFPYPPGEQFIELEIGYWGKLQDASMIILPSVAAGPPRPVPDGIDVRPSKSNFVKRFSSIFFSVLATVHPLFWREIKYLINQDVFHPLRIYLALKSVALTLRAKHYILRRLRGIHRVNLAYSYWNNESAYALCLLKRNGKVQRIISRAHRFDLYEEVRQHGYMPLKRQFVNDFDGMHSISEDGKRYLCGVYGFSTRCVQVSRLGVQVPEGSAPSSRDGIVRILSVSFCVWVKRIHKIIEAIHHACSADPTLVIEWTHIGDGPLRRNLEETAQRVLGPLPNTKARFMGLLSNSDVTRFMRENPVDVFINSSASEGIPVSIMEAMAYGIPAVAPAVGGIAELVNSNCGALLPEEMNAHDVDTAIRRLVGNHASEYRKQARRVVEELYSAPHNYSRFVADAFALANVSSTNNIK